MLSGPGGYALILATAALGSALLSIFAWRRRRTPGATSLALLALAVAEWSLCYTFELLGRDLTALVFWRKVAWPAIAVTPVLWFTFTLEFTGYDSWLTRRRRLLLAVVPAITLLLVLTNDQHRLVWTAVSLDPSSSFPALLLTRGVAYFLYVGYADLLLAAGLVVMLPALVRAERLYRRQAGVLLATLLLPWLAGVAYVARLSPVPQLDPTPLAYALSALLLGGAIFYSQLLDLLPAARETVLEDLADGVIVADNRRRVVMLNATAARLVERPAAGLIGRPFAEVAAAWPALAGLDMSKPEGTAVLTQGIGEAERFLEARWTPLMNWRTVTTGQILTLHDVTIAKKAEMALRQAEARYRTLVEQVPAITYIDGPDERGSSQYVSPQVQIILGYAPADWQTNPDMWRRVVHPQDMDRMTAHVRETLAHGRASAEYRLVARDSREVWVRDDAVLLRGEDGQPHQVQGILEDITERKHAEAALRRQAQSLEALHNISLDLLNRRKLDEVMQVIVEYAAALLDAPYSAVVLVSEGELTVEAYTSNWAYLKGLRGRTRADAPLTWRAVETRRQVIVDDYMNQSQRAPSHEENRVKLRANANFPILAGAECRGVIVLGRTEPGYPFSEHQVQSGVFLAQLAALVLDNAALHEAAAQEISQRRRAEASVRRRNESLAALHQITLDLLNRRQRDDLIQAVVENASDLLGGSYGDLSLLEGDELVIMACTAAKGALMGVRAGRDEARLAWQAFDSQLPVTVADYSAWEGRRHHYDGLVLRAVADFPIVAGGKCLGVLGIGRAQTGQPFSGDDLQIGLLFAQLAALVLDNVSLYDAAARELAERRQTEAALALARDQALDASRFKSQLLAKVSHELRTPLSGALGFADMLKHGYLGPLTEPQTQAVSEIVRSADYLNLLINDLLDEAQLEARAARLNNLPVAPLELARAIEARMSILAAQKGLALVTSVSPDLPGFLFGDERRLQQIMVNLTGNAIKFTETGSVEIRLTRPDSGHWAMQVSDSGIGIPLDAQTYIFEPFRQVDAVRPRDHRGTGLGLSIVKQLAELMGGTIGVESRLGQGSTFTVTLPLREHVNG